MYTSTIRRKCYTGTGMLKARNLMLSFVINQTNKANIKVPDAQRYDGWPRKQTVSYQITSVKLNGKM